MTKSMRIFLFIVLLSVSVHGNTFAQKSKVERPYKCGFYVKNFEELKRAYEATKFFDVQTGEKVASVGAANGNREVITAAFIDGVEWTIQDIDTVCLNETEFQKVLAYNQKIKGKPIIGQFRLVIGEEKRTNLPRDYYDRIIMANVYHELTDRESMLKDIHGALNETGIVLIQERMNDKPGKVRKDCGHIGLFEPDLVKEMRTFGYVLDVKKSTPNFEQLAFYTFRKIEP